MHITFIRLIAANFDQLKPALSLTHNIFSLTQELSQRVMN